MPVSAPGDELAAQIQRGLSLRESSEGANETSGDDRPKQNSWEQKDHIGHDDFTFLMVRQNKIA